MSRVLNKEDGLTAGTSVRLINYDNEQLGVCLFESALERAEQEGFDLVLVSEDSNPPVCRLMDVKKRIYEAKKAQKEAKKKQQVQKLKEIKFHATIDKNDFNIKVKNICGFIEKGYKVKISLRLRGREMAYENIAMGLMNGIIEQLKEVSVVDDLPKLIGKDIHMTLSQLKKK